MSAYLLLRQWLDHRLERKARDWFRASITEVADGVSETRFCALLSLASRHVPRRSLDPTDKEQRAGAQALEGWNPERWDLLEAVRVALILSRADLAEESAALAIEEAFRYADEGELRALYRSLALLPGPERFLARAREGCRTNMRSVFEATALDTPYPARFFDDEAWNQAVIKCLFIGAPLWRMWGLDGRLSPELARMALDLADERRSAGRAVPHELWLCLGTHGGERGLEALEDELARENPNQLGRRAAVYGLARAGEMARLKVLQETEQDPLMRQAIADAIAGNTGQSAFANLIPSP